MSLHALFVVLPDDDGPIGHRVQRILDQQLDVRLLLLEDEDLLRPARELAHRVGIARERHLHLEDADPERADAASSSRPSRRNASRTSP